MLWIQNYSDKTNQKRQPDTTRRTIIDTNSTRVHATRISIFFFDSIWINENVVEFYIGIHSFLPYYIDTWAFVAKELLSPL